MIRVARDGGALTPCPGQIGEVDKDDWWCLVEEDEKFCTYEPC